MQKTKDNKTLCLHFQANPYLCFLLIEEMKLGSDRLQVLEESQTLAISKKVRELKAAGMDILGLTLGEPDFETPEPIRAAAIQAIQDGFTNYPPVAALNRSLTFTTFNFSIHYHNPTIINLCFIKAFHNFTTNT
jgi:hypothetical protein